MAEPHNPAPALLVVAAFSRHLPALAWACEQLSNEFGDLAISPPSFAFHHTKYYETTMGPDLRKQLFAFRQLLPQDQLAAVKLRTNQLEKKLTDAGNYPEPRPLNLDPGILTLGKFMLVTTKDQAQRIYLRDGIFAEVTLRFEAGEFVPWPWTYADYREPVVRQTLKEFRDYYRQRLHDWQG